MWSCVCINVHNTSKQCGILIRQLVYKLFKYCYDIRSQSFLSQNQFCFHTHGALQFTYIPYVPILCENILNNLKLIPFYNFLI